MMIKHSKWQILFSFCFDSLLFQQQKSNLTHFITKSGVNCKDLIVFLIFSFGLKKSLKIPKRVIRIRESKDRQHNDKKKRTNNDLQNIHINLKLKDRETRISLMFFVLSMFYCISLSLHTPSFHTRSLRQYSFVLLFYIIFSLSMKYSTKIDEVFSKRYNIIHDLFKQSQHWFTSRAYWTIIS